MLSLLVRPLIRRVCRSFTTGDFRLMRLMAADDVTFFFPGANSFSGTFHGKEELIAWVERFAALHPTIEVYDVVASGPPWNMRVAVRLDDTIGDDYRNQVVELLTVRWGKLRHLQVFLDTERISAWETRHPELATTG